jgi:hypothetical protein
MTKRFVNCLSVGIVLMIAATSQAQVPEMPKPTKEHALLAQFAGEWNVTAETVPAPGEAAIKCEGTESAKLMGGFWLVSQAEANMMGMPVKSLLTIGYSPASKKYTGTFVCTMDSTLWKYDGAMDEKGQKLTLETEGPSPLDATKKAKFREILELKDKDHKTFTSFMQGDDGKWQQIVTMEYRRKK